MINIFKIKKNLLFLILLLPVPLIVNAFLNIFNNKFYFGFQNTSALVELNSLFISMFLFIFYLFLGKLLQKIFKTTYITSSIILFWLIVFGFDNSFIFLTKHSSFQVYILLVFVLLGVLSLGNKINFRLMILLGGSFILLRIVLFIILSYSQDPVVSYENLYTSDEKILWYPALQGIFEDNYYSLLTNNPFPGYGLLTAYIGAINSFIIIGFSSFNYYLSISYIFIFLFFTFIFEICTNKKTFIYLLLIFLSIIMSSHWFTYVFFGSILSEVVSSFCFGVLFTEIVNKKNKNDLYFLLLIFSFGFIYFSRQFISTLVVLFVIYQMFKNKNYLLIIGLYGFFLKLFQSIVLPNTNLDPYINENEFSNLSFNFANVSKMIKQFLIDRPVTYLFLIFFLLIIFNLKKQYEYIDYYVFLFLNVSLVILLMIFIWRKDDVQSSYRYLLNTFYLIIYPMAASLDSILLSLKQDK